MLSGLVGYYRGGSGDGGKQSVPSYSADPVVDEVLRQKQREKRRKESRKTVEWEDRWLVVHQGILSIGNDRPVCPERS